MIKARNLVKRYGSTMAVNDLSFSIRLRRDVPVRRHRVRHRLDAA